jgi:curved DNA-binding protein CbpA
MKQEHQEAGLELDNVLNSVRPKNLEEGVTKGVGNVLSGAIGGVGVLVLGPTAGLAMGCQSGGIVGGLIGLIGGTVVGALGSVAMIVGGTLSGITQLALGIIAVPGSISGPAQGKWWNDVEGKWVETNLTLESKELDKVPKDDRDILGDASDEKPDEVLRESIRGVKDPQYYEVLGVEPSSDQSKIKRQYYLLARQYHPDKVSSHDITASDKFKDIAEAYQVLSDPKLRKVYDKEGREGLTPDRTEVALEPHNIDATLMFAFLFGSDNFYDYIGRLATGTSALLGDANKLSVVDARKLQKRRCTRIAIYLTNKLGPWITENECVGEWEKEVRTLSTYSYGYELVQVLGQAYSLSATQFLGSLDSGIGMPSLAKWAKSRKAAIEKDTKKKQSKIDSLKAGMDMLKLKAKAEDDIAKARTEEEKKKIVETLVKDELAITLQIMWTVTAFDITSTIHEACQMVFFNKAFEKKVQKRLAKGVAKLGEIFLSCPEPEGREDDPFKLYEEATFAATLETIKRKEEASFNASFRK